MPLCSNYGHNPVSSVLEPREAMEILNKNTGRTFGMYDDYVKHPLATVYNAVLKHSIYSFDISVERAGQ